MDHSQASWSAPSMLSNIRVPSSQIIESLSFMFNNSESIHAPHHYLTNYRRPIKLETLSLPSQFQYLSLIGGQYRILPQNLPNSISPIMASMQISHQPQNISKVQVQNKKSYLLTAEENELIFSLLGRKCFSLSTTVAQLLVTVPPDHINWIHKYTCVVCLVKDNPKRSYFIRLFDIEKRCLIWEQEIYICFEYKELRPFFHAFEADSCMAGLNFPDEMEARHFFNSIQEKLANRTRKNQEKRANIHSSSIQPNPLPTEQGVTLTNLKHSNSKSGFSIKKNKENTKKKTLTKEDIGIPTNFQHVHHIGYNAKTNNYESNDHDVDNKLMQFLLAKGFSGDMLNNEETIKFINLFAKKHGGMEKMIAELENPPPLPQSAPVVSPVRVSKPIRNNQHENYTSQSKNNSDLPMFNQPVRKPNIAPTVPAPPPPPPQNPPPSLPPVTSHSVVPPPPPPPPPPLLGVPPPPPAVSNNIQAPKLTNPVMDNHSALMDQIKKGSALNHVEPSDMTSAQNTSGGDGIRDQLLNQIRKGVDLKKVEPNNNKPEPNPVIESGGLAGALARALQDRSRALNQTDDSSDSNSNSSDDEWED